MTGVYSELPLVACVVTAYVHRRAIGLLALEVRVLRSCFAHQKSVCGTASNQVDERVREALKEHTTREQVLTRDIDALRYE